MQVDGWVVFHQVRVNGVPAGVHLSSDQDDVADLQCADLFLRQWRPQRDFPAGPLEPRLVGHCRHRSRRIAIEPLRDLAGAAIQHNTQPPERPAVVCDRHEKARRKTILRADLAAYQ